jgi:transmembrane sensor
MKPQVGVDELLRYLTGESSEDEARHVQVWSRLHAANAALLEALRYGGDEDTAQLTVDVAHGIERLQSRLNDTLALRDIVPHRSPKTSEVVGQRARQQGVLKRQPLRAKAWYAIASVVFLVLGILVGRHSGTHRPGGYTPRSVSTYTTTNGQRANITLLDGTTVALNVASRLDVPADFAGGNHVVHLTGEALITVTHHAGMPFTVLAGTTPVHVLGTTFAVRHYGTDTGVAVAVREGRVEVGSTVLSARQAIEIGPHRASPIQVASASAFSFATGTLALHRMSLLAAIPLFDRWYDADIRLGNPDLATQRVEGEFDAGSLEDLARILTVAFDVRVAQDGRVLTLYPRSPQ